MALNSPCGTLIADDMGLGKAQPLDAKILTPHGWNTMGRSRLVMRSLAPAVSYTRIWCLPAGRETSPFGEYRTDDSEQDTWRRDGHARPYQIIDLLALEFSNPEAALTSHYASIRQVLSNIRF